MSSYTTPTNTMSSLTDAEKAILANISYELIGVPQPDRQPFENLVRVLQTTHRQVKHHTHDSAAAADGLVHSTVSANATDLYAFPPNLVEETKKGFEDDNGLTKLLDRFTDPMNIDTKFAQNLNIKSILQVIMRPTGPFSLSSQTKAAYIYGRFDAQQWGQLSAVTPDQTSATSDPTANNKRDSSPAPASATPAKKAKKDEVRKKNYPNNHILFGEDGPYPGCATAYHPSTTNVTIRCRKDVERKSPAVRGHNGFTVGDWFPSQMSTVARGAHGATQGGIFGTANDGAFSIISTKTYAGADKGNLLEFDYCAPNSIENADATQLTGSAGLDAMRTSRREGHEIRVFRGVGACAGAPSAGIRYDGLYKIVKEASENNTGGGVMIKFGMKRVEEQAEIDQSRPSVEERGLIGRTERLFEKIKRFYRAREEREGREEGEEGEKGEEREESEEA